MRSRDWRRALVPPALAVIGAALCLGGCGGGDRTIKVTGNIELTEVALSFKMPGKLSSVAIEEGDFVKKGTAVARLDDEELTRERDQARAALEAARSRLAQLEAAVRFGEEEVEGSIQRSRAELRRAEAVLKQLLAGSRRQEIEAARAALERAESGKVRAAKDWERARELFENEDISKAAFDEYRDRHESAEALWEQARQQYELIVEGPRKEEIEAARAQVESARAGLRLAEAGRLELEELRLRVGSGAAERDQAEARLALIEKRLEDTVIMSPMDGVVLVKAAEAGEVIAAGAPVATVGDLARPWLRAYIDETDLGRVKLGAKADVATDSFPGKIYGGRLIFISPEAEFTPKQIQTERERVKLVYRIKIELDNSSGELKLNMPCDAEIRLDEE